jgi:hypothetical protein
MSRSGTHNCLISRRGVLSGVGEAAAARSGHYAAVSRRHVDRHRATEAGAINEQPTHPFRDRFDLADAMGQTRSEYVGLARQDALDIARDAGFETRVLDLLVTGDVVWRDDILSNRLNLVVDDGTVIRAAVF